MVQLSLESDLWYRCDRHIFAGKLNLMHRPIVRNPKRFDIAEILCTICILIIIYYYRTLNENKNYHRLLAVVQYEFVNEYVPYLFHFTVQYFCGKINCYAIRHRRPHKINTNLALSQLLRCEAFLRPTM